MVAARTPRMLAGFKYEDIINSIDWNRVVLEAQGEHLRLDHNNTESLCGTCIRNVLLRRED